jgi:hypothetical protein
MSNFEIGYCSLQEYQESEQKRVMESELSVGGLYTLMLTLRDTERPAAKYPCMIRDVVRRLTGDSSVAYTILNGDLAPSLKQAGIFSEGYWRAKNSPGIVVANKPAEAGYLKEFALGTNWDKAFEDMLEKGSGQAFELQTVKEPVAA